MLHKNDPLYFLDLGTIYPRVQCLVVSFPLDKMRFKMYLYYKSHFPDIISSCYSIWICAKRACSDQTASYPHSVSYFYWPLTNFATEVNPAGCLGS